MALSKVWTLAKIKSILRVLVNEIAPDKIQDLSLVDYINLATQDLAEMLNGATAPDYGETKSQTALGVSLGASYTIDTSAFTKPVDRITKIVEASNGLVLHAGDYEFEGLKNIPQKQNNVWYNMFGETIYVYYGSGASDPDALVIYYYRQPTLVSSDADFVDVRDKYVPLLIAKAKNLIYEHLKMTPPDSLSQLISQKTAEIRQLNQAEKAQMAEMQRT